jgi:hypothetical protein
MVKVFTEWTNQFFNFFVDDVNIHNSDWSEHLEHLILVFKRLRSIHLKLNPGKCCFGVRNIVFLGHVVNEQIKLNPTKMCVVSNFFIPSSITNVWAFMGFIKYYKTFIQGYAKIVGPLFDITWKDLSFQWTPLCQSLFHTLKHKLLEALVLTILEFLKTFILDIDWSIKGIGSIILSQKNGRQE